MVALVDFFLLIYQIRLYMVVLVVVDPVHGEVGLMQVELVVFQVAAQIQTLVMQVVEAPLILVTNQYNRLRTVRNQVNGKVIISALILRLQIFHFLSIIFQENLSIGSIVGTFSTTDPDDTNGTGIYTYQLIIDPNKTLLPSTWIQMVP